MDGYAVRVADVAGATEENPVTLPVAGDIAGRRHRAYALAAGHRDADHDRRAAAARRRRRRPGRVDRRRLRRRCAIRQARRARPARPPARRGRRAPATWCCAAGTGSGPRQLGAARRGRARPGSLVRPGPGSWCCPPATSWSSRAPGPGSGQICDVQQLHARRGRRARRAALAVRGRHRARRRRASSCDDPRATSCCAPTWSSPPAGSARAPTTSVKEVLSRVGHRRRSTRSRCSRACRRGSATLGEDETPIFTLPGNPVSAYRLLRGVRPPGAAPDGGPSRAAPGWSTPAAARRAGPRPAGRTAVRPGPAAPTATAARRRARRRRRARTWSAAWPRPTRWSSCPRTSPTVERRRRAAVPPPLGPVQLEL